MTWLRRVVETKGIPVALYVDRQGIFQRLTRGTRGTHAKHEPWTLEEELAGGPLPTSSVARSRSWASAPSTRAVRKRRDAWSDCEARSRTDWSVNCVSLT